MEICNYHTVGLYTCAVYYPLSLSLSPSLQLLLLWSVERTLDNKYPTLANNNTFFIFAAPFSRTFFHPRTFEVDDQNQKMSSEYTDTFNSTTTTTTIDDEDDNVVVVVHRLKTEHERRLAEMDQKYAKLLPRLKVNALKTTTTVPTPPPVTKYPLRFLTNVKTNSFPLHIPFRVRKELQLQRALLKLQK